MQIKESRRSTGRGRTCRYVEKIYSTEKHNKLEKKAKEKQNKLYKNVENVELEVKELEELQRRKKLKIEEEYNFTKTNYKSQKKDD